MAVYGRFPTTTGQSISYVPAEILLRAVEEQVLFIQREAKVNILKIYIANWNVGEEKPWGLYIAIGVGGLLMIFLMAVYCK